MQTQSQHSVLRRSRRVAAAAFAVGSCLGALTICVSQPALAQNTGSTSPSKKVSLNLVGQPVQTALRLLFTSEGINNSIDQDVQGSVTINVSEVSFDTALRALLAAANPPLTYDVSGGVYHVSVKRDLPPVAPVQAPQQASTTEEGVHAYRIPIDHYDAGIIAQIIAAAGGRGGVIIVPPNNVAGASGQGGANGGGGRGGQGGGFGGGQGGGFGGGQGGGFGGGGGGGFGGGGGGFGGGGGQIGGGGFGGGNGGF